VNSIYPNLWAPTAGPLQGLTVMQQCVYQIKFRNVCDVKKQLVQPVLVWSRTLWLLVSINGENVFLPVFTNTCPCCQRFKQFYCRQLKNGQLNEMSAMMSEMWTKYVFTRCVN